MQTKEVIIGETIYTLALNRDIEKGEPFLYTDKDGDRILVADCGINVHDNSSHAAIIGMRKNNTDKDYSAGKMDRKQFLLAKLSEECDEVSQRALKALIFGMEEKQPNQELDNRERLFMEVNDLLAILELMQEEKMIWSYPDSELVKLKKQKVEHYYAYSRKLGIVE